MPFTSGLLLAAGASRRFGAPKLLHPFRGEPLIMAPVRAFLASGVDEVVVVAGALAGDLLRALDGLPVRAVVNDGWESGMFSSVLKGLAALDPRSERVAVSPADLPGLTAAAVRRVVEQSRSSAPGDVTVPTAEGRRGHPVVLPRDVVRQVLAWPASSRLDLVFAGTFRVRHLEGFGPEVLRDVDFPSDLQADGEARE